MLSRQWLSLILLATASMASAVHLPAYLYHSGRGEYMIHVTLFERFLQIPSRFINGLHTRQLRSKVEFITYQPPGLLFSRSSY